MTTCPKCFKDAGANASLWYCPFCGASLKKKVHPVLPLGSFLIGLAALILYGLIPNPFTGFFADAIWMLPAYFVGAVGLVLVIVGISLGKR